jgi:head-tail adaptor
MLRHIATTTVDVYRFTVTADGAGGQTETWRKVATVPCRLQAKTEIEGMQSDALQVVGRYTMICDRNVQAMPNDRVKTDTMPGVYFEVSGTDFGQTALLVQHVDLVQYGDGDW